MSDHSDTKRFPLTVVRIPIKEASRDEVLTSPQWFDVLDSILAEPNRRFIINAWEVDDSKLDLLIGWKADTGPSAAFLSSGPNLEQLLAPIHPFRLSEVPQVINMHREDTRMGCMLLECAKFGGSAKLGLPDRIMEVMLVRGPEKSVEPAMKDIEESLNGYSHYQRLCSGWKHAAPGYPFNGITFLFREDDNKQGDKEIDHDGAADTQEARFALFMRWSGRTERSLFQDPAVLSSGNVPPEEAYGNRYWEDNVATKLRSLIEQGASVSSWDYMDATISRSRERKLTISRKDKIW
jgi:hypothetical protein